MTAIDTSLRGGMITGKALVILFSPLFFVLVEKLFGRQHKQAGQNGDGKSFFNGGIKKLFARRRPSSAPKNTPPEEVR